MIVAFVLGGLVAVPVTLMIVIAALVFGPAYGLACAVAGTIMSAALSYGIGRYLGRDTVRRLAGDRINRLSRKLARRGVVTVAAVRLLPIAPFTVVNMVAGASHIGIRDFLIGTLIGMLPGMCALTIFADSMFSALSDPMPANIATLIGIVALILMGFFVARRALRGSGGARDTDSIV
jgi:uncharacterized membrane protein YdjX (TVP38/TMEM64 family)